MIRNSVQSSSNTIVNRVPVDYPLRFSDSVTPSPPAASGMASNTTLIEWGVGTTPKTAFSAAFPRTRVTRRV